nr:MAG TPA: hypothetical protein [Caudoviricetes sp.]
MLRKAPGRGGFDRFCFGWFILFILLKCSI